MYRKSDFCRSDSKLRAPAVRVSRASLQVDGYSSHRRSSSLDAKSRNSGSLLKPPRSSSDERKSIFNNWNTGRKSSLNVNEKKTVKDPRPLTDKTYQKEKAKELIEYLKETEFKYPMSLIKFIQPSKKDFDNMFEHLVSLVEPNFTIKKVDEDAPVILKNLCYRFIPNKSAFQYVARTNWPPLLGILLFLMDLGKFRAKLDFKEIISQNDEYDTRKELPDFLDYVRISQYNQEENEERENEIFRAIIESCYPCDIEELENQHACAKSQLQASEEEVERFCNEQEKVKEQADQISQYASFFTQMERHMAKKKEEYEHVLKTLEETESELSHLKRALSEKQSVYDAQGFDGRKKMSYFLENKEELARALEEKRAALAEVKGRGWDAEIEMGKLKDKEAAACEVFNALCDRLESAACAEVAQCGVPLELPQLRNRRGCAPAQRRAALQEARARVGTAHCVLAGVAAAQGQKLQEVRAENTNLLLKIKTAVHESQLGKESSAEEKKLEEENAALESEIDLNISKLSALQNEKENLVKKNEDVKEELREGYSVKKEKKEMRADYLQTQSGLFSMWSEELEKMENEIVENGMKTNAAVKRLCETASAFENKLKKLDG